MSSSFSCPTKVTGTGDKRVDRSESVLRRQNGEKMTSEMSSWVIVTYL